MRFDEYLESGTPMRATVSADLLATIFSPYSPLHDGAVLVRGDEIVGAGCILPLTQNPVSDRSLGTRHRAALGLSEETDALVLVVSEETAIVSLAARGTLQRGAHARAGVGPAGRARTRADRRPGSARMTDRPAPPYRAAAALTLAVLAGYVLTLAPRVTFWDAGEFIAAARILGVPHPPGTPLFVMIAHVWGMLVPVGEYAAPHQPPQRPVQRRRRRRVLPRRPRVAAARGAPRPVLIADRRRDHRGVHVHQLAELERDRGLRRRNVHHRGDGVDRDALAPAPRRRRAPSGCCCSWCTWRGSRSATTCWRCWPDPRWSPFSWQRC